MPSYRYQAKTRTGQMEQGAIEAGSEDEAISILQGRELLITSLTAGKAATASTAARPARKARGGKATQTDMVALGRAVGTMLDAGLPLLKSLEITMPQVQSRQLQTTLQEVIQDIRGGNTFKDSIAKHPKVFTKIWVSLVETGEASGQLSKALEQITIHLEKAGAVQRKVVSAMVYPAILITVSVGAILVFLLKIIPTFANLFSSFGMKLPLITQLVVDLSTFIRVYAPLWLGALGGGGFLLWRYVHTTAGRWQLDGLLLQLPLLGPLMQSAAVAAFATGLGTMIKAGVPILHGLEITIASSGNVRVAHVLEQMRAGAREGRPLADPLRESDLFPPMVAQMVAVGEETGKLANMLDEIAKYYEEQVNTMVERFTGLLEPMLLLTMGGIIGVLVLAMYLPIFQLSQTIRG